MVKIKTPAAQAEPTLAEEPGLEPDLELGDLETPPAEPTTPWLTTASSAAFGPAGHILNLTDDQVAAAPDGLLVAPSPEQLAQRL